METSHAARSVRAEHCAASPIPAQPGAGADLEIAPAFSGEQAADRIAARLVERLGAARFERYFGAHPALRLGPTGLEIPVTSGFLAGVLDRRYKTLVLEAALEITGSTPADVKFIVSQAVEVPVAPEEQAPAGPLPPPPPARVHDLGRRALPRGPLAREGRRTGDSEQFNLAHFITGAANRLAYEAASRLAGAEPSPLRGPVFIHAGCGFGKTHLLSGLASRFQQLHPGAPLRRVTADQFTSDYIGAVRSGRVDAFRRAYRGLDLLCIDDIGALVGRNSTQQELVYTIDAIAARNGRVCVVGAAPPRQIAGLSEALASRLMAGMVIRIEAPEPELRERIAVAGARRRGLVLDDGAASMLARSMPEGSSVREIEGLILKIEAIHRLIDGIAGPAGRIGVGTVQRALSVGRPDREPSREFRPQTGAAPQPVRFQAILATVCRQVGVQESEVLASGRHALIVLARSLSAWVARQVTTMSFPEIARALQRPNHSTVITACQRIQRRIGENARVSLGPQQGEMALSELGDMLIRAVRAAG